MLGGLETRVGESKFGRAVLVMGLLFCCKVENRQVMVPEAGNEVNCVGVLGVFLMERWSWIQGFGL